MLWTDLKTPVPDKNWYNFKPRIETEDLTKLYNNIYMDQSTPINLINRFQMNAILFFCQRANANMESMTNNTFVIWTYSVTGRKYIMKKVDKLTTNRREMDREIFLDTCRRILKRLNIVWLETLRPTLSNFTFSAKDFGNFLKTAITFPMNIGSNKDR